MIDPRDLIYIPADELTDDLTVELASGVYPDSGQPLKTTLGDMAQFFSETIFGVPSIQRTFVADGAFPVSLPAGALIIGGRITPNTATGATVSLGTTLGASDVLVAQTVPGGAGVPYGLQGVNFSQWSFPTDQTIFAHAPSWASMTITIWFLV